MAGETSFRGSAPRLSNKFQNYIKLATSKTIFCYILKTHLFKLNYLSHLSSLFIYTTLEQFKMNKLLYKILLLLLLLLLSLLFIYLFIYFPKLVMFIETECFSIKRFCIK